MDDIDPLTGITYRQLKARFVPRDLPPPSPAEGREPVAGNASKKPPTYADGTRKHRMELLPLDVLIHVANAFEAGLKNGREANEWRRLPASAAPEYLGATIRHIEAMQRGECFDPDAPHVPHFAAAIASLCIWGFHEFRKAGA